MTKRLLRLSIVLSLAVVICLPAMASANYVETFDSNNAGWQTVYTTGSNGSEVGYGSLYSSTGGNSGGYIYGPLANPNATSPPRIYGFEPTDLTPYGDLTGKTLTVEFKIFNGTVTSPSPANVYFYVGSGSTYYVTTATYAWDPNLDTDWTTHQVAMTAADWQLWPNFSGPLSFAQVIANPTDIGLVFADDFQSASDIGFSGTTSTTIGIDNFGAVPLPPSALLLGSGLLGMIGLGWRRRRSS
jgi:hypothetical protein